MSSSLPIEVLEILVNTLLDTQDGGADGQITTILTVCKRWYDVFLPILWKDLVIRGPSELQRFVSAPKSRGFSLVRSFTVSFEPQGPKKFPSSGDIAARLLENGDFIMDHGNESTREL